MSANSWVLLAFGTWLAMLAALQVCVAGIKRSDLMQSEVLSSARRARFVDPRPRPSQVGG